MSLTLVLFATHFAILCHHYSESIGNIVWTDVMSDLSKTNCSPSTAALKNLLRGACSVLLVMM